MFIDTEARPTSDRCVDCEHSRGWWLHLRRCAQCGHIGCCDTSPFRHARAHALANGHRIVQSFEPRKAWFYDFATAAMFEGPTLADPQHHPVNASSPGPHDRVPQSWRQELRDLLLIRLGQTG